MIKITVPATTANIGAGFDCMGMAFKLYNKIWAEETADGLSVLHRDGAAMPTDDGNLVYQSILRFCDEVGKPRPKGLRIEQESDIPAAMGLGSSAACVIGGLLAANALTGVNLKTQEMVELAAKIETHPDNSTPALVGGLTVCAMGGGKVEYVKLDTHRMVLDGLRFAVFLPGFTLETTAARAVLPESYPRADLVFNASRAALTVAALMGGAYSKLWFAVDDHVHQPYRAKLIPGMDGIFAAAKEYGARAAFLSGAGPAVIALFDGVVLPKLRAYAESLPNDWRVMELEPDDAGAAVEVV